MYIKTHGGVNIVPDAMLTVSSPGAHAVVRVGGGTADGGS